MRILVFQHEAGAPAGLLEDWARTRAHRLHVVQAPALQQWPDPNGYDAVVSLGSECSVRQRRNRWIAAELRYLSEAHESRVPLLGICFGAQALAAALGGSVARAPAIAVEWSAPDWREAELIPAGPWLRWHEDVFTVPPGARAVASCRGTPLAFVCARSVGLQFHPEADAQIAAAWIAQARGQLDAESVDMLAVERALAREASAARTRAYTLFDRIATLWAHG